MRIIIDAMGGDNAPDEILKGVIAASDRCDVEITLVGNEREIIRCINQNNADIARFDIIHTESVVGMGDDPLIAIQTKKDSSMMISLKLLAEGYGDAFVSAGNTGALFSGATLIVKRAEGVKRAAIGTLLPGAKPCLLLDAGANVSVTEEYLEQFAEIGSSYMKKMFGLESPKVGILNNGTEDGKGTPLQIETGKRLKVNQNVNFIGNIEASSVMKGECDVVVCDGFTGNIFLKASEGVGHIALKALKEVYSENLITKLSYLMINKKIKKLKKLFDSAEYGGSPILGISKPVIKAHGSSDAYAFMNAILQAVKYAESNIY